MAMITKQKIIWHSNPKQDKEGNAVMKKIHGVETDEPDFERVEIPADSPVPKVVPMKIQEEWLSKDMVRDDPSVEAPDKIEGPPSMLLPRPRAQR